MTTPAAKPANNTAASPPKPTTPATPHDPHFWGVHDPHTAKPRPTRKPPPSRNGDGQAPRSTVSASRNAMPIGANGPSISNMTKPMRRRARLPFSG